MPVSLPHWASSRLMRFLCSLWLAQDAQAMFDSSMSAAAIVARVQELQAAAGIKAQLVNPAGRGAGIITLTGWVRSRLACSSVRVRPWMPQGGRGAGIITHTCWVRAAPLPGLAFLGVRDRPWTPHSGVGAGTTRNALLLRAAPVCDAPAPLSDAADGGSGLFREAAVLKMSMAGCLFNCFSIMMDTNCVLNMSSLLYCQVALAALVSLVMVVVGAIVFGYRRWAGLDRPYTVVTKQGDV